MIPKNKKGFLGFAGLITILVLGIILLGLLVWFGFKINEGLVAFWSFLAKWWWAVGTTLFLLTPVGQAVLKFILSKIGVKM